MTFSTDYGITLTYFHQQIIKSWTGGTITFSGCKFEEIWPNQ